MSLSLYSQRNVDQYKALWAIMIIGCCIIRGVFLFFFVKGVNMTGDKKNNHKTPESKFLAMHVYEIYNILW